MTRAGATRSRLEQSAPSIALACLDPGRSWAVHVTSRALRRLLLLALWCPASTAAADPEDPFDSMDPPRLSCRPAIDNTIIKLSFLPDSPVRDLVVWMAVTYCKSVAVDAAVLKSGIRATVTPGDLKPKQALRVVVDAIKATGLVVVQKPDTIIIELGPNMQRPCGGVVGSAPLATSIADPARHRTDALHHGPSTLRCMRVYRRGAGQRGPCRLGQVSRERTRYADALGDVPQVSDRCVQPAGERTPRAIGAPPTAG